MFEEYSAFARGRCQKRSMSEGGRALHAVCVCRHAVQAMRCVRVFYACACVCACKSMAV